MDTNELTIGLPRNALKNLSIAELSDQPEVVEEILFEQKEASKRTSQLGIRKLGKGMKSLIWLLRLYVIFMVVVVIINVAHTIS